MKTKAVTNSGSVVMFMMIIMIMAYVINLGGFQDVVNGVMGNNSTAQEGLAQHITTDNASHNEKEIEYNSEPEIEPQSKSNPNTNIEPSFFERNSLIILFLILGLSGVGYLYYKRKVKK